MFGANMAYVLAGTLALLMIAAAVSDLRSRTISNGLNGLMAVLAIPYWFAAGLSPWPEMAMQLGVALLVFAAFAGLFALGAMGGGDVKMLGAVALWFPWHLLLPLLTIMAVIGGLISGIMIIDKKLRKTNAANEVPYGVAIAVGGLWALHQQYLNHFSLPHIL